MNTSSGQVSTPTNNTADGGSNIVDSFAKSRPILMTLESPLHLKHRRPPPTTTLLPYHDSPSLPAPTFPTPLKDLLPQASNPHPRPKLSFNPDFNYRGLHKLPGLFEGPEFNRAPIVAGASATQNGGQAQQGNPPRVLDWENLLRQLRTFRLFNYTVARATQSARRLGFPQLGEDTVAHCFERFAIDEARHQRF